MPRMTRTEILQAADKAAQVYVALLDDPLTPGGKLTRKERGYARRAFTRGAQWLLSRIATDRDLRHDFHDDGERTVPPP